MHVVSIIGARPQIIKVSAISHEMERNWPSVRHTIVHTGQHYDNNLSSDNLKSTGVRTPDLNLQIASGSHGQMTGAMLIAIENVLNDLKPDWCLNYGDTNTTLATALAAVKLSIPSAHIEAGMRRYDLSIPEEVNRRVTDHVSDILFTPTDVYRSNLLAESVPGEIITVGDINYDAFKIGVEKLKEAGKYPQAEDFVLCTVHRPVNTDMPMTLTSIFQFLGSIDRRVVLPLHPRTRNRCAEHNIRIPANIEVVEPVPFDQSLRLLLSCSFVVTDSGGLQKEAFFAGKRCITLAADTPWVELKDLGVNKPIAPAHLDFADVAQWVTTPIVDIENPYGDGNARAKIVAALAGRP